MKQRSLLACGQCRSTCHWSFQYMCMMIGHSKSKLSFLSHYKIYNFMSLPISQMVVSCSQCLIRIHMELLSGRGSMNQSQIKGTKNLEIFAEMTCLDWYRYRFCIHGHRIIQITIQLGEVLDCQLLCQTLLTDKFCDLSSVCDITRLDLFCVFCIILP